MPLDTTQFTGAWPGYADGSTDARRPTPREAQQHPDTVVLIDRLNTALEERDHWRRASCREHTLVEHCDAALKQARSEMAALATLVEHRYVDLRLARGELAESVREGQRVKTELAEALGLAERMQEERNNTGRRCVELEDAIISLQQEHTCKAREWLQHFDRCRTQRDQAQRERDEARTVARRGWDAASQWKAAFERARAALVDVTAVEEADDDPGTCANCGGPLEMVRPGKVQCPDCGVCEHCGRTTYRGKCPRGCDQAVRVFGDGPKDYSEEPS